MKGVVLYGINNRYTVQGDDTRYECTLKGKQLRTDSSQYTALAPGDEVEFRVVSDTHEHGVIDALLPRRSQFARWNNKRNKVQVFAANIDGVACVMSTNKPSFRMRFADRVLASAELYEIEPVLVINKIDLGVSAEIVEYTDWMKTIGCTIVFCSARTGEGFEMLHNIMDGKRFVLSGHSGVGKTSILNRLVPGIDLAVGAISRKYQKGVHTTRYSRLVETDGCGKQGWIVDVPGIREIELVPDMRESLAYCFPEIRALVEHCLLPGCTHLHEPDCAVINAVENGELPEFRYESYCALYEALEDRHGNRN